MGDLQHAGHEYERNAKPLFLVELQVPYHGQWKDEYRQIGDGIQDGTGPRQPIDLNTTKPRLYKDIPALLWWNAREQHGKEPADRVHGYDGKDCPTGDGESSDGLEDSEVKNQQGCLDEQDAHGV